MPSIHKARIDKQGRIVLPKSVREAYELKAGDELTIITKKNKMTLHPHKTPQNPLEDLAKLAQTISIELSARELKEKAEEERTRDHTQTHTTHPT